MQGLKDWLLCSELTQDHMNSTQLFCIPALASLSLVLPDHFCVTVPRHPCPEIHLLHDKLLFVNLSTWKILVEIASVVLWSLFRPSRGPRESALESGCWVEAVGIMLTLLYGLTGWWVCWPVLSPPSTCSMPSSPTPVTIRGVPDGPGAAMCLVDKEGGNFSLKLKQHAKKQGIWLPPAWFSPSFSGHHLPHTSFSRNFLTLLLYMQNHYLIYFYLNFTNL